jgi:hypothetical protein
MRWRRMIGQKRTVDGCVCDLANEKNVDRVGRDLAYADIVLERKIPIQNFVGKHLLQVVGHTPVTRARLMLLIRSPVRLIESLIRQMFISQRRFCPLQSAPRQSRRDGQGIRFAS